MAEAELTGIVRPEVDESAAAGAAEDIGSALDDAVNIGEQIDTRAIRRKFEGIIPAGDLISGGIDRLTGRGGPASLGGGRTGGGGGSAPVALQDTRKNTAELAGLAEERNKILEDILDEAERLSFKRAKGGGGGGGLLGGGLGGLLGGGGGGGAAGGVLSALGAAGTIVGGGLALSLFGQNTEKGESETFGGLSPGAGLGLQALEGVTGLDTPSEKGEQPAFLQTTEALLQGLSNVKLPKPPDPFEGVTWPEPPNPLTGITWPEPPNPFAGVEWPEPPDNLFSGLFDGLGDGSGNDSGGQSRQSRGRASDDTGSGFDRGPPNFLTDEATVAESGFSPPLPTDNTLTSRSAGQRSAKPNQLKAIPEDVPAFARPGGNASPGSDARRGEKPGRLQARARDAGRSSAQNRAADKGSSDVSAEATVNNPEFKVDGQSLQAAVEDALQQQATKVQKELKRQITRQFTDSIL